MRNTSWWQCRPRALNDTSPTLKDLRSESRVSTGQPSAMATIPASVT